MSTISPEGPSTHKTDTDLGNPVHDAYHGPSTEVPQKHRYADNLKKRNRNRLLLKVGTPLAAIGLAGAAWLGFKSQSDNDAYPDPGQTPVAEAPVDPNGSVDTPVYVDTPASPSDLPPEQDLSPAEVNAALLESFTMDTDQVLSIRNSEVYMDTFMDGLGSAPQVITDSSTYIDSVQIDPELAKEDGYELEVDVSYYPQLSDSLGIYTNVLNANQHQDPEVFDKIKNGAAKDIMKNVYFTSGAVDPEDVLDVSDDVVVRTLTQFVESAVPDGAVISDFEISTVRIMPNPDDANNGTWANITVTESNGDTWYENVKLSNSRPDVAKSLNDPFEGWSVTADYGQPLQVGFNYNPDGSVDGSNDF